MVGMTVGFTKTNRHPLVVLYEGRNAVDFLSIFCTIQPVGIGLVDSWTSPRGFHTKTFFFIALKMSNLVTNSHHLREVLLHYFISKKTAAETHHILVQVYGEHASSETTCRDWFRRFKSEF